MSSRLQRIDEPPSDRTLLDRLSRDDIEDITSRNALSNGERYWRQGRVLSFTVEKDGARIKALVRGSRRQPYSLAIGILDVNGELLDIIGECSCPVGYNCKHVAAVLFEAIARHSTASGMPRGVAVAAFAKSGRASGSIELFPDLKPARAPIVPPPEVLDSDLATWIDSLARLEQTETEDYPPDIRQRLIYVLDIEQRSVGVPHLVAKPTSVRLLKDGRFSDKTSAFNPETVLQSNVAKFLRPSDRDILKRLHATKYVLHVPVGTPLVGEEGVGALTAMIGTGRVHWGSIAGPVVTRGPARQGRLIWRLADDGSQYPDFALDEAPGGRVLRLAPPWYVETATAVMGPIETGYAARVAAVDSSRRTSASVTPACSGGSCGER